MVSQRKLETQVRGRGGGIEEVAAQGQSAAEGILLLGMGGLGREGAEKEDAEGRRKAASENGFSRMGHIWQRYEIPGETVKEND